MTKELKYYLTFLYHTIINQTPNAQKYLNNLPKGKISKK